MRKMRTPIAFDTHQGSNIKTIAKKPNPLILFTILIIISIYFSELIRTAWISDDAGITLRTVLNFINGYGPRFNIDERVQAYTHTAWFFLLSLTSTIFKNVFTATFITSITVSILATLIILDQSRKNLKNILLIGMAILLSKSYLDYSTSGLENPLSHLLLIIYCIIFRQLIKEFTLPTATSLFLTASILYLNRPDLAVAIAPSILFIIILFNRKRKKLFLASAIGLLPFMLWTLFSIFYYGFPFPNTAYAKLGTGIAQTELYKQGLTYMIHSAGRDPVTAFIITLAIATGLFKERSEKFIALGIIFYLFYTIRIGGDFMEGRFLTPPFTLSLAILSKASYKNTKYIIISTLVIIFGTQSASATIFSNNAYKNTGTDRNGISDERGTYFEMTGLFNLNRSEYEISQWEDQKKADGKRLVRISGSLGFSSIRTGPAVHHVDMYALSDPLLSRLPAIYDPGWRIGHFERTVQAEYLQSISEYRNAFSNEEVHAYYGAIQKITRGKLFDRERLIEIIKFNSGHYKITDLDPFIYGESLRRPGMPELHRRAKIAQSQ